MSDGGTLDVEMSDFPFTTLLGNAYSAGRVQRRR